MKRLAARCFREGGRIGEHAFGCFCSRLATNSPEFFVPDKPRYVLFHPGSTATSFAGELDESMRVHVEALKRSAKPASTAAVPIIRLIDQPPKEPLSAFMLEREIDVKNASFDPEAARRLDRLTRQIIS